MKNHPLCRWILIGNKECNPLSVDDKGAGVRLFCIKKVGAKRTLLRRGAGGRTRTGTVSPPVDFESTTSANSITPAKNIAIKSITNYTPSVCESQDLC